MSTFTIKPITKPETEQPTTEAADAILLQAVIKYKELQAQIKFLSSELQAPRAIIESACNAAEDYTIITPQFQASFKEEIREDFNSKACVAALGREKLKEFFKSSIRKVLRVA